MSINYTNARNTNPNVNLPSRGTGTTGNVSCNSCQNGQPVGVGMFPIGQCPPGSSTDHNPCNTRGNQPSGVTCYGCVNGVLQGRSYINLSVCPSGETTDSGRICPQLQDDCYDCNSETMNRVPRGTCPEGANILSSEVNSKGSSKNPCPTKGCMNSTANNFNSLATVSDGSCTFTETDEEIEKKADIIEDLVADTQTAGLGDSKIILYLGIGILAYFLLKDK